MLFVVQRAVRVRSVYVVSKFVINNNLNNIVVKACNQLFPWEFWGTL